MRLTFNLAFFFLLNACSPQTAPNIAFQNIKGDVFTPEDYKNDVLLINFWATTCTSCVKKMPALVKTHKQFEVQNFKLFAVAMQYDRPDYVLHFANENQLPFHVVLDINGQIAQSFGNVQATPTTFLVAPNGKIVEKHIGDFNLAEMNQSITQLLSQDEDFQR